MAILTQIIFMQNKIITLLVFRKIVIFHNKIVGKW
jgi:hypothetical protein